MPKLSWSDLIADGQGRVDITRLYQLVGLLLALLAGLVIVCGMAGIIQPNENLRWGAGMLVAPIMVGLARDGMMSLVSRHKARAIIAGTAAGRRAVDRGGQP